MPLQQVAIPVTAGSVMPLQQVVLQTLKPPPSEACGQNCKLVNHLLIEFNLLSQQSRLKSDPSMVSYFRYPAQAMR